MIVNDFDIMCIHAIPAKANSPLIIYPDAMLPRPVPQQNLQTITRQRTQIINAYSGMNQVQLPPRHPLNVFETGD